MELEKLKAIAKELKVPVETLNWENKPMLDKYMAEHPEGPAPKKAEEPVAGAAAGATEPAKPAPKHQPGSLKKLPPRKAPDRARPSLER